MAVCVEACRRCERCNYITVNPLERDCSWYHHCDMDNLHQEYGGFLSGPYPSGPDVPGPNASGPNASGANVLAVATSRPARDRAASPPEVVLFMHLEKTAGTLVRKWMKQHGWECTGYCLTADLIPHQTVKLLDEDVKRIFVEHHCGIDW